ncbi:group XIIA secretory phospholipase A2-like, partial [Littorina saxatilis]|uniref:group XIIA secretory phospholipase A2-like n=1 Tax=Littorina saxatilis TaxID=31220 RepID=UPI0038B54BC0
VCVYARSFECVAWWKEGIRTNNDSACFFTTGADPVAKRNHVPESNGCGSFGVQLDTSRLPGIAKCCDRHDVCYHTCNKGKEHCDDLFKACLINMCKAFSEFVSEGVYDGCKSAADVMYVGTLAVGCAPYVDSQRDACVCPRNIDEL